VYRGPVVGDRGTARIDRVLRDKAEQAERSGATWLLFVVNDGLWQFTEWSAYPLPEKTVAISDHCERVVAGSAFHGVIFTSGSAQGQGTFSDESHGTSGGRLGLRRCLPLGRVRETMVIPLPGASKAELETVFLIFD